MRYPPVGGAVLPDPIPCPSLRQGIEMHLSWSLELALWFLCSTPITKPTASTIQSAPVVQNQPPPYIPWMVYSPMVMSH
ncbi:hypothetical protein [Pasteuria penetrans]|uniref:hypothetical protein n=1 Tax=Pasteuria penetrans TaxID=86005 RepID=UPI000F924997|nr:hypothetical protein [Pasteuria penetrans]